MVVQQHFIPSFSPFPSALEYLKCAASGSANWRWKSSYCNHLSHFRSCGTSCLRCAHHCWTSPSPHHHHHLSRAWAALSLCLSAPPVSLHTVTHLSFSSRPFLHDNISHYIIFYFHFHCKILTFLLHCQSPFFPLLLSFLSFFLWRFPCPLKDGKAQSCWWMLHGALDSCMRCQTGMSMHGELCGRSKAAVDPKKYIIHNQKALLGATLYYAISNHSRHLTHSNKCITKAAII